MSDPAKRVTIAIVAAIALFAFSIVGGGDDDSRESDGGQTARSADDVPADTVEPPPAPEPSRYTEDSPEYQLALIDDKASSPDDEYAIRPYARELDLLERRCTNPRSRLADFTVSTFKQAERANVSTSNLKVLHDVRDSTPPGWKRQGCRNLFALYTVLLVEG